MKRIIYLALSIALMTGCAKTKPTQPDQEKAIRISVSRVTLAERNYSLRYSGTVEASQTIPLTFRTAGTVSGIYAEVGDAVRKGQILASLDNTDMLNIYNVTKAKYDQAKDAYNRLKSVYDQGSLPEIKWVEMETSLEQAKSSFELSENNLEKCNMRAPVNGIVGRRNIEPGQSSLGVAMAPIELVQIGTVYVKISVPENEISRIHKGQKAEFHLSALDGKQFEGVVVNVSPVADIISRTYAVKISVGNPDYKLKPGMVCDVSLNLDRNTAAIEVPYKAVSKDIDGNTYVYVVSSDSARVRKQNITVGKYGDSGIEVLDGLTPGEVVVTGGFEKVTDNSLISL